MPLCPICSSMADSVDGVLPHVNARDVTMLLVSRAPLERLQAYKRRMGWSIPWASTAGNDFNFDLGVSFTPEQVREQLGPALDDPPPGLRRGGDRLGNGRPRIRRGGAVTDRPARSCSMTEPSTTTYSTQGRGVEFLMGYYPILDRAPKGRDEGDSRAPDVTALDPATRRVLMEAAGSGATS